MKNEKLGEWQNESFEWNLYPDKCTLREISFYLVAYYLICKPPRKLWSAYTWQTRKTVIKVTGQFHKEGRLILFPTTFGAAQCCNTRGCLPETVTELEQKNRHLRMDAVAQTKLSYHLRYPRLCHLTDRCQTFKTEFICRSWVVTLSPEWIFYI